MCLNAQLAALIAHDGYSYELVTEANAGATTGYLPLGPTANVDSALMFGFDSLLPFPGVDLTLLAWSGAPEQRDQPVACGLPASAAFASGHAALGVLERVRMGVARADEGRHPRVHAHGRDRSAHPAECARNHDRPARYDAALLDPRAELRASTSGRRALLAVRAEHDDARPGRDGAVRSARRQHRPARPGLRLDNVPVLTGSLRLEIDQGSGFEVWTEVPDFFGSGPNDLHYALNRSTGEIRFGDGFHGAIPVANPANPSANVVAAEYRYGGGTHGNVPAGTLKALRNAVEGIDDNAIKNVMPSYGGRDEETLDEAKQRAPAAIRARCRAVTADDFEYFAKQAANVARAHGAAAVPPFVPWRASAGRRHRRRRSRLRPARPDAE